MARVLIVEDDRILNNAYQMILTKDRHTVAVAFDGQAALDQIDSFTPDIILLDLLMPGMGGIEFLQSMRQQHPSNSAQIIVLSNMGDTKLVAQAREYGADKYIIKAHTTPGQLSLLIKRMDTGKATPKSKPKK